VKGDDVVPESAAQNVMSMLGHRSAQSSMAKPSMREVFEAEESHLLQFAFGFVARRELAEEVVQEAFLALFENFQDVENPRAWLFRCVRNKSLNELRKTKREVSDEGQEEPVAEESEAPDEVLGRLEATGQLRLLMAELEPKDETLLRLKYFEGMGYKEIAQKLELSVGNVGYRLHHVLKGLADGLRKVGVERL